MNQLYAYRLFSLDGELLLSTDGGSAADAPDPADFEAAVAGDTVFSVIAAGDDPLVPARAGEILRVLAPVRLGDAGAVLALAETHKPYAPVAQSVRDSVTIVLVVIGVGVLAAVFALGFIVQRAIAGISASERRVASLNDRLQVSMRDIEKQSLGVLQALSAAVDAKDRYTARHSLGATELAHRLGTRLGLDEAQLSVLERASLLHDIGKIGVPEAILLKPGQLTAEEFERAKEHSEAGAKILETVPFLGDVVPVVRYHHESWDGTGYPAGLSGEDIPELARVLAVADAFDAMTTERPYRAPVSSADALAEIMRCSATQFDPKVVVALQECVRGAESA